MSRIFPPLVLAVLVSSGLACSPSSPKTAPEPSDTAIVRVKNEAFNDVVIYIVRSGQQTRVGTVSGNNTETFTFGAGYINGGPVRFIADPIGSGHTPVSDEMVLQPGEIITLTIPPQ